MQGNKMLEKLPICRINKQNSIWIEKRGRKQSGTFKNLVLF